jgi:beta-glucosidase
LIYLGNYYGHPDKINTILGGIEAKAANTSYEQGCSVIAPIDGGLDRAEALAQSADIVIATLGLASSGNVGWCWALVGHDNSLEGENGDTPGDRMDFHLPAAQRDLLARLYATGKPVIIVLVNATTIADPHVNDSAQAVVEAWYPGQAADAVADVLFGDYNPAGRLPYTWFADTAQLPDIIDYDMTHGRTYRYYTGEPLYPFGYGLSYTTFAYSNLTVSPTSPTTDDTLTVSVDVKNTGSRGGDEVVQLYTNLTERTAIDPIREMHGFCRVNMQPGETKHVSLSVPPYALSRVDAGGNRTVSPGRYGIAVGGGQPGAKGTASWVSDTIALSGATRALDK